MFNFLKRYKEPSFVGFRYRRPIEALKIVKIVAFFAFLGTLLWFSLAYGSTIIFEDDFDGYTTGDLNGQGTWTAPATYFQISAPGLNSSTKKVQGYSNPSTIYHATTSIPNTDFGEMTWYVKTPYTNYDKSALCFYSGNNFITGFGWGGDAYNMFSRWSGSTGSDCGTGVSHISPAFGGNTEHFIKVDWNAGSDTFSWSIDATSTDSAVVNSFSGIDKIVLRTWSLNSFYWTLWDEMIVYSTPPSFRIWGDSPVSGTEITASSTNFTFGYEGFSTGTPDYWDGILINFCEETTGICAEEKKYTEAELGGTSGQKTLSFENFNFDTNGDWYFEGKAYVRFMTANFDVITAYSYNVVSPEYFIKVNFEGLPEIFKVEVPVTWYSEHTDYATPTMFFSSVSGILSPLFSKIGDFGSRITGFFNQTEAFSRGKNIGAILPTFKLYIAQFSFLFGGFPIIETFILAMVVMVGFFLFKLVFRLVRG